MRKLIIFAALLSMSACYANHEARPHGGSIHYGVDGDYHKAGKHKHKNKHKGCPPGLKKQGRCH
ncbi:MAG: hypothetical protein MK052_04905 [Alphaproteobacteria bacterium]|nr:hypothetical protein [Alphaproteobacteria bacterium]